MLFKVAARVVDGEAFGKILEFFDLIVSVMLCIFDIDFSEEGGVLFDFSDFFEDESFAVDLFDLFGFQIGFALKICYFC